MTGRQKRSQGEETSHPESRGPALSAAVRGGGGLNTSQAASPRDAWASPCPVLKKPTRSRTPARTRAIKESYWWRSSASASCNGVPCQSPRIRQSDRACRSARASSAYPGAKPEKTMQSGRSSETATHRASRSEDSKRSRGSTARVHGKSRRVDAVTPR